MRPRTPLPSITVRGHLTRAEAREHGVSDGRLRAADLERLAHGLYRQKDRPCPSWSSWGLPEPGHGLDLDSLAALVSVMGSFVSHHTAAHLYGVPLPDDLARDTSIHVTGVALSSRSRRPGVVGHRRPLATSETTQFSGIPIVTPERMWLDLAGVLLAAREEELVIAGDHLVTPPWWSGRRVEPLTTVDGLKQAMDAAGTFKGVRLARAALPQVRVGADSRTETLLRLELIRSGLPEPKLQVFPATGAPFTADMAYPQWKIALQYDGGHHLTREQQVRDARRDAWFQQHGWMVIRVTSDDLRHGFRRVVGLIKAQAARTGS